MGVEKIWAKVLQAKYVKSNSIPDMKAKCGDSVAWPGILKSLHHVHTCFGWSISNGERVSLWFDPWLVSEPLCLIVEEIE